MHGGAVHGRGHAWQGACLVGACIPGGMRGRGQGTHAPPGRYHEIQLMSGRYASYWNAFLFFNFFSTN